MGTWGAGSFENDDASDLAIQFESDGLQVIYDAINFDATGYLDAPEAQRAIAGAEILAILIAGQDSEVAISPDLDEAIRRYAPDFKPQIEELRGFALAALDRIEGGDSELKELWEEEDATEWHEAMAALKVRLMLKSRQR